MERVEFSDEFDVLGPIVRSGH